MSLTSFVTMASTIGTRVRRLSESVKCEFTVTRGDTDVTLVAPFLIVPPDASRVIGVYRTAGLPDVEPVEGGFALTSVFIMI